MSPPCRRMDPHRCTLGRHLAFGETVVGTRVPYEELRAAAENVVDVELVAAMQVEPAQLERLVQALKRRLRRDIRIKTRIDPSLIGGAVVRAGDLVVDGSLTGRLRRLATALTA